jgi:hypothetical protein
MEASRVCNAASDALIAFNEDDWDIEGTRAGGSSTVELPFPLFSPVGDIEEGSALVLWLSMFLRERGTNNVALFWAVGLSEASKSFSNPPTFHEPLKINMDINGPDLSEHSPRCMRYCSKWIWDFLGQNSPPGSCLSQDTKTNHVDDQPSFGHDGKFAR